MRAAVLAVIPLAASLMTTGCGCPVTAGPTGPTASLSGTVAAGDKSVQDYAPPQDTTQMEVIVRWNDPSIPLRLQWIDANCNPLERDDCRAFSEPIGPFPNSTEALIRITATNQGPAAGPRMRFVVLNGSADRETSYTMTIAPRQAGCT
jgi:hypothetical protein